MKCFHTYHNVLQIIWRPTCNAFPQVGNRCFIAYPSLRKISVKLIQCLCDSQIPQFLLDDCSRKGEPCRIFCTQPRRLAAIAVAERVAAERGERVGQTVGYHIRLESRYINYLHYVYSISLVACLVNQEMLSTPK